MIKSNVTFTLIASLVAYTTPKEQITKTDSVAAPIITPARIPGNATLKQDGLYHIKPTLGEVFEYSAEAENESKRLQALQKRVGKGELKFEDLPERDQLGLDELGQSGDYWSVGVSPVPQWIEEFPPSKVWASSTLAAGKNVNYKVANLMDYDLRTVWSEGAAGNGLNEFVAMQFPGKNKYGNTTVLTSVTILNGYVKNNELWKKNGRVKTFRLSINDKPFAFLDVEDSRAYQTFDLGSISNVNGFTLKFEITEVYPGSVYEDVVLSYFDFDGDGVLCVDGQTQIAMADGSFKHIALIKPGDEIVSWDATHQCTTTARVETIGQTYHNNLVEIDLEFTSIIITDDHPLLDSDNHWRAVKRDRNLNPLNVSDKIQMYRNKKTAPAVVRSIQPVAGMRLTFAITQTTNNQPYLANGVWIAIETPQSF
jgi:hypothetical protein